MRWLYFSQIKVVVLPGCLRMLGDSIAERFTRKIKSKEIAADSCKYKSEDFIVMKKARTKEELEAEVKSLQKKLKC